MEGIKYKQALLEGFTVAILLSILKGGAGNILGPETLVRGALFTGISIVLQVLTPRIAESFGTSMGFAIATSVL